MSSQKPASYPPKNHIVRDLDLRFDRNDDRWAVQIPVVPEILDATRRPRMGVLAMVVDMIAGERALSSVLPKWIATSSLSLHVDDIPNRGIFYANPKVLRGGKTNVVLEVELRADPDASEPRDAANIASSQSAPSTARGELVGLSTLHFAILPNPNPLQTELRWPKDPVSQTEFRDSRSEFSRPLLDTIGLVFDPQNPALARISLTPYLENTLGAMQGGVVAMVLEATANHFARSLLARPCRVRGLEIHYLRLAKKGPFRSQARVLGQTGSGYLLRTELIDEQDPSKLLTVATVTVDEANSLA